MRIFHIYAAFLCQYILPTVRKLSLAEQSKAPLVSYTAARLSDFDSPSSEGSTLQDPESFALKFLAPEFKPPLVHLKLRLSSLSALLRETNTSRRLAATQRERAITRSKRDIIRDVTLAPRGRSNYRSGEAERETERKKKRERAGGTIYL